MGTNVESVGVGVWKGEARSSRDGLSDETRKPCGYLQYPIQWNHECKGFWGRSKKFILVFIFLKKFFSLKDSTKQKIKESGDEASCRLQSLKMFTIITCRNSACSILETYSWVIVNTYL